MPFHFATKCVYNEHTKWYSICGGTFMAAIAKTSRIDLRISDEDKSLLEQAADIKNVSLSNYILSIIMKQAELDVRANENLVLSDEGAKFVLDLLDNPPEPTPALKKLIENANKINK